MCLFSISTTAITIPNASTSSVTTITASVTTTFVSTPKLVTILFLLPFLLSLLFFGTLTIAIASSITIFHYAAVVSTDIPQEMAGRCLAARFRDITMTSAWKIGGFTWRRATESWWFRVIQSEIIGDCLKPWMNHVVQCDIELYMKILIHPMGPNLLFFPGVSKIGCDSYNFTLSNRYVIAWGVASYLMCLEFVNENNLVCLFESSTTQGTEDTGKLWYDHPGFGDGCRWVCLARLEPKGLNHRTPRLNREFLGRISVGEWDLVNIK